MEVFFGELNRYVRFYCAEDGVPFDEVGKDGFLPWDYIQAQERRWRVRTKAEVVWVLENFNHGSMGAMFLYHEDGDGRLWIAARNTNGEPKFADPAKRRLQLGKREVYDKENRRDRTRRGPSEDHQYGGRGEPRRGREWARKNRRPISDERGGVGA